MDPAILDAQRQAWTLANPSLVFNPDAAVPKKWLELKRQGILIGVPIGDELALSTPSTSDPNAPQTAQSFTSGAVLVWRGGDDVELA